MLVNVRLTMMETFVYKVLLLDAEWTGTVGIGTKTKSATNCCSDEVGVGAELGNKVIDSLIGFFSTGAPVAETYRNLGVDRS